MLKEGLIRIKDEQERKWLSIFSVFSRKRRKDHDRIIEEISRIDKVQIRVRLMLALSEDLFKSKRVFEAIFLLERALSESDLLKDPVKRVYFRTRYFLILDKFTIIEKKDLQRELKDITDILKNTFSTKTNRDFFIGVFNSILSFKGVSEDFKKGLFKAIANRLYDEVSSFIGSKEIIAMNLTLKDKDVHNTLLFLLESSGEIDLKSRAGDFFKTYIVNNSFIKAFDIVLRLPVNERSEAIMIFFNIICSQRLVVSNELKEMVRFYVDSDQSILKRVLFSNKFNSMGVLKR